MMDGMVKRLLSRLGKAIQGRFSKPLYTAQEASKKVSTELLKASFAPLEEIFRQLECTEKGLSQREARRRLEEHGANEIAHERPPPWYLLLLKNFKNPFVVLVMVIGAVSFFLHQYDSVIIISCMVIISVLMRFVQEYRSNKAAEKLKALVSTKATVLRCQVGESEAKSYEVDIKFLVPGDILHLSAGDMIPADLRLIKAKELSVSQSALSGESLPVDKEESFKPKGTETNPLEMPNLCLMGTNVLNGSAIALVLNTGNRTYFGTMSESITGYRTLTNFDLGINKVTWLLIRFIIVMVPVVFLINAITKDNWLEAFLFSLSVAIGLTPEMLPMIVTANLATGAVNMSRKKVVVKRLNAIQNFGAMDILCTDKTGTLTQNRIILEKHLDAEGRENDEVLLYGYLNSFYQTGLKNLLDLAVLDHAEIAKQLYLDKEPIKEGLQSSFPKGWTTLQKVDEIPFDFTRRRMSVVIQCSSDKQLLICKGAVEETFAICNQVQVHDSVVPMQPNLLEKLETIRKDLSQDGLRVLAVSYREFPVIGGKVVP